MDSSCFEYKASTTRSRRIQEQGRPQTLQEPRKSTILFKYLIKENYPESQEFQKSTLAVRFKSEDCNESEYGHHCLRSLQTTFKDLRFHPLASLPSNHCWRQAYSCMRRPPSPDRWIGLIPFTYQSELIRTPLSCQPRQTPPRDSLGGDMVKLEAPQYITEKFKSQQTTTTTTATTINSSSRSSSSNSSNPKSNSNINTKTLSSSSSSTGILTASTTSSANPSSGFASSINCRSPLNLIDTTSSHLFRSRPPLLLAIWVFLQRKRRTASQDQVRDSRSSSQKTSLRRLLWSTLRQLLVNT